MIDETVRPGDQPNNPPETSEFLSDQPAISSLLSFLSLSSSPPINHVSQSSPLAG